MLKFIESCARFTNLVPYMQIIPIGKSYSLLPHQASSKDLIEPALYISKIYI